MNWMTHPDLINGILLDDSYQFSFHFQKIEREQLLQLKMMNLM